FDAAASVPDCWVVFDNGVWTDVSWNVDSTNPNGGTGNAAYLNWDLAIFGPSNAEDWLVTPAIDLTNVADAELTFYTMTSGNPNDTAISTYTIRISTGSQTNAADFTIVETFTEADLGAAYNQKTINLAAYAGQTVHIAFVMEQDINAGGDDWSVDDVMVEAIIPVQNELFFSEYIEGSSSNKYLEIYNPTGSTITLTDYSVELYANGNTSPNNTEDFTLGFPATLASGDVIILQHQNANVYTGLAFNSTVCNFNGNDAIVLKKGDVIIDIIGNIGCDPGSSWEDGDNETINATLVRNMDVCGGVTTNPSPCLFPTLITEWTPFATDDVSNLGFHDSDCLPSTDYVYNNGWTPADPSGISTDADNIQIIAGTTNFTAPTTANNLTIDAGTTLTINADAAFTATGTIVNNGALSLGSTSTAYSSLITDAITGTGEVTYNRHVNTGAVAGEGGN